MKAVILIGGEGTRLRPLTLHTPKSMVPIINRPFLEHMLEYLKEHYIDDIILTLCYLPDRIHHYFGDGSNFGIKLTYAIEDPPLGTAGAVKNVAGHLDEAFFVFNGDIFTDIDLTSMLRFHRQRGSKATIALTPVDDPTIYGVVETDSEGRVQRFIEKPRWDTVTTSMINAGAYILEPEVLDHVPIGLSFSFELGLFPLLLDRGDPVYGYQSDAYWIDIGTPEKYLKLHYDLLTGLVTRHITGKPTGDGIWVDDGCDVHPQAELQGSIILGRNCVVGSRARVKGPSIIGQDCIIEAGSFVEGAVIWQNAHLKQGASLNNCIIADNVIIGERTQVTDGCVLGKNVIVDSNQILVQGTKIEPEQIQHSPKATRR